MFLFTDIEGSTRLWEANEQAMRGVIARHDQLLRAAIERHGGIVFSTAGDGLAAAFASVFAAVNAALSVQSSCAAEAWPISGPVRVRIGIHLGEAESRDGDWFGSSLNRAARVMSVAHGGQIVVTDVVAEAVRHLLDENTSLVDLGVHHLRDVSRAQRLWQVTRPGLDSSFPPLRSMGAPAVGLPVYLTSFVGRDDDLAALLRLCDSSSIVTMTGSAGVGKTRLATEVAARSTDTCADGVWFVELASLAEPSGLDDMVATILGVAAASVPRRNVIIDAIGQRHMMLVLDNAEHLLSPVADLVGALVHSCRALRVLVTSRELLGVAGEQVWPVRSLAANAAVDLFTERARRASPQVDLNEALMRRICTRLDGIPMAIELAAARVRSLSLGEIATRIDARFDLLTVGQRGVPERHRTIHTAIDWSYRLLDEEERTLFERVSVFAGGFDLAAAESVTGFAPLDPSRVVDVIDELVTKSMVVAEVHLSTTRFRLLEALRDFAAEHLGDGAGLVAQRHGEYYTAFAEARGGFALAEDPMNLERVIDELDNFRAAFNFALANDDADTALRLTTSLHVLWHLYDFAEVGIWVAAAADMHAASHHPLATTAHGQAAMAATYRLDIPAREHHLIHGMGTFWGPYARSYLNPSTEPKVMAEGHEYIRLAVALAKTEHPLAQAILHSYNALFGLFLGRPEQESWDRVRAYANEDPNHGLLLLRRAEAHRALYSNNPAAALAAYDDVLAMCSRAARRSMLWVWATVPRLLLLFNVDRRAALVDARSYLIEARNAGSRRFVQPALGRIAVMLAGVGREEAAAALQSFTRQPTGGAGMSDGDPAASLTFETLTAEHLNHARERGARLAFDAAIQFALDELEDAITEVTAEVPRG